MIDIVSLDFSLDWKEFYDIVDNIISDESSRTGISFDWNCSEAKLSRSSKSVYKIVFKNNDNSNTIEMVANKEGNNIKFEPLELRNYNNSFYKCNYDDDDLAYVMFLSLEKLATKAKGDFGCILKGQSLLIKKGRNASSHITGLAILDDAGRVYNIKHGKVIDEDDDEDDDLTYIPKLLINEWLDSNKPFKEKLNNVPKSDQFDMMAQFAIYQKQKDMINASQFRDIIIQVGNFADLVGGFKDESVKSVYQFFV